MESVECIIIGAGVVGLAIARALAIAHREVLVVEAAGGIGTVTSSRNSEVIHAGIYYRNGSVMAQLCVAGRKALYEFCRTRGVAHENCGKLIVATRPNEEEKLADIARHATGNGVDDLRHLNAADVRALEPDLFCTSALLSPSTGIFDSHAYMLALQGEAEAKGAVFAFHAPAVGGDFTRGKRVLRIGGATPMDLSCRLLINAAGLAAPSVARTFDGLNPSLVPQAYYAKGNYFVLTGRAPFSRLIYPMPEPGGLGVHLTLDLQHRARFGPDVEWVETIDYQVDPHRAEKFYAAIRRYWPDLKDGALQPGYSGIRPKIVPQGAPAQDFFFQGPKQHGIEGLINLFGIESPGLTSSLAIAAYVTEMAGMCAERSLGA